MLRVNVKKANRTHFISINKMIKVKTCPLDKYQHLTLEVSTMSKFFYCIKQFDNQNCAKYKCLKRILIFSTPNFFSHLHTRLPSKRPLSTTFPCQHMFNFLRSGNNK